MASTRNELKERLLEEIDKVCPENIELDADTLNDIETCVDTVIEECNIDSDDEDEEEEVVQQEK